jgi:hypothetical protein
MEKNSIASKRLALDTTDRREVTDRHTRFDRRELNALQGLEERRPHPRSRRGEGQDTRTIP